MRSRLEGIRPMEGVKKFLEVWAASMKDGPLANLLRYPPLGDLNPFQKAVLKDLGLLDCSQRTLQHIEDLAVRLDAWHQRPSPENLLAVFKKIRRMKEFYGWDPHTEHLLRLMGAPGLPSDEQLSAHIVHGVEEKGQYFCTPFWEDLGCREWAATIVTQDDRLQITCGSRTFWLKRTHLLSRIPEFIQKVFVGHLIASHEKGHLLIRRFGRWEAYGKLAIPWS